MNKNGFIELIEVCFRREILKKLIFSRPSEGEIDKIRGRLVAHRGRRMLVLEEFLPGNTVSQRNVTENALRESIVPLLDNYRQINLLTTAGDAEYKISKKGSEVFLGADSLERKIRGEASDFEKAIEALDKVKNHLLTGKEEFLIRLGISSSDGRVHDKKQGKFRQINRFLEHIEDILPRLPKEGEICIFDLCSGKSYLSFAVYYYLTAIKGREVDMLCVDLKRDVINWCESLARELDYSGMRFCVSDISDLPSRRAPDMVISLHACDVATDIVIDNAVRLGAGVILSTPCCHRYLNGRIKAKELSFVTEHPHISNKLCEAITDALRLARLRARGYSVSALELTDPENTPKNTLLRAIKRDGVTEAEKKKATEEYEMMLSFVLGDGKENYLKDI